MPLVWHLFYSIYSFFGRIFSIKLALFSLTPSTLNILIFPCFTCIYIHLHLLNIGFVFSNIPFHLVSDLDIRISGFRPKAGLLALFFQIGHKPWMNSNKHFYYESWFPDLPISTLSILSPVFCILCSISILFGIILNISPKIKLFMRKSPWDGT